MLIMFECITPITEAEKVVNRWYLKVATVVREGSYDQMLSLLCMIL